MTFISCVMYCCTSIFTQQLYWSKDDIDNMSKARIRCKELYKQSPCLVKFIKMEPLVYRATCGRNNNE